MKTLITALNSKFVHMSLAPWYLKAACEGLCDVKVLELTINQDKPEILRRIFAEKPNIVAFSCYIYNITQIQAVVMDIKIILPDILIVFGGPEVTYTPIEVLSNNESVDFVICGEGERRFRLLLAAIEKGEKPAGIDGIAYRDGNQIEFLPPTAETESLDILKSPYTNQMTEEAKGKIAYFEASRGCPFGCSYCLSSTTGGVRRFSMERVKDNLMKLMLSDARQVKFVDRTFNCGLSIAKQIVDFIIEAAKNDNTGKISIKNYHFEVAADLFDDELIEMLISAPPGLFQLEIGIQSFNEKTLESVGRKTNLELCRRNIKMLLSRSNMHIHLDLIAGLPYEDFDSFAASFNELYKLRPNCIQLGFLKLLGGSKLREDAESYGYGYSKLPPYEVLSTPWLDYNSLLILKRIETAVDALYNSGKFTNCLSYIITFYKNAFCFFNEFSKYLYDFFPGGYGIPSRELYNLLLQFSAINLSADETNVLSELAKFDFFSTDSSCNPPSTLTRHEIPGVRALYAEKRESHNRVHFERFSINPLDFRDKNEIEQGYVDLRIDYGERNPVTGLFRVEKL